MSDLIETLKAIACQVGGEELYKSRIEWKAADEIERLEAKVAGLEGVLKDREAEIKSISGHLIAVTDRVAELEGALCRLLEGCGNHACRVKKPVGMGTNGPCRCAGNIVPIAKQALGERDE